MTRKTTWIAAACLLLGLPAFGDQIQLSGIVRDLKRGDQTGGHPDFQTAGAANKFGLVTGMVTMTLGEDAKPVFNPTRPASKDTMKSASSFYSWFHDVPNTNVAAPLTITLANGQSTPGGIYSFDNQTFFPIDGKFFGNQGLSHNYHFTFELHTQFSYQPGQKFTFIGDDDVWVYVNGSRVIDLGGVHAAVTGKVILLDGKAFVDKANFATGGVVQVVTTSMAASLAAKWTALGLTGACPIVANDKFIELDLNQGDADVRCTFNGASATVKSSAALRGVVVKFTDGTQQTFVEPGAQSVFSGTGAYAGKTVAGCWARTARTAEGSAGQFFGADGSGGPGGALDFFFAERHTTESHFRIDTTMMLKPVNNATISPLYD